MARALVLPHTCGAVASSIAGGVSAPRPQEQRWQQRGRAGLLAFRCDSPAACSGVVERGLRREPPRSAIASQPAPPTRYPIVFDLGHGSSNPSLPLPGSRRRKRARTPARSITYGRSHRTGGITPIRIRQRPHSQNRVTHASRLVARIAPLVAFGLGKFVATAVNQGARRKRCPISQIGRLHASRRSIVKVGPLSAATARFSRAGPRRARPASR